MLEAKTVTTLSRDPLLNPRANRVRDFLDRLEIGVFLIGIDELSAGKLDLPLKHLERHVRLTLADTELRKNEFTGLPPLETRDGWRIRLTAIRSATSPRTGRRILYEACSRPIPSSAAELAKALIGKAARYGRKLDRPFVIALGPLDPMLGQSACSGALLGPKSLWGTEAKPRYERVSAVLFTIALWPETLLMGHLSSRLYLNPFAARPYDGVLTAMDTYRLEGGTWRRHPGIPIHHMLQLTLRESSVWD